MKKIEFTQNQLDILNDYSNNIIVSAGAGTGKTGVLVEKIQRELENNTSYKTIAGITFTIKAANEIKDRLLLENNDEVFIGTNNSFAIQEIITPFMWDIYGLQYRTDFDTNYLHKVNSFQEGLEYMKTNKAICSYGDIKKNFVFELALDILKKSQSAQLYLQSKYFKIFIDEYQDCDEAMNNLFMQINHDLNIKLFIVGDEKQSIYMWKGAVPSLFQSLMDKGIFKVYKIDLNFRCSQQIQNMSNILFDRTSDLYKSCDDKDSVNILKYQNEIKFQKINESLNKDLKTAVLAKTKKEAIKICTELNKLGNDFIYIPQLPIDDLTSRDSWIYKAISDFYFLKNIYNFYEYMPIVGNEKENLDMKDIKELQTILNDLFLLVSNKELFNSKLNEIANFFDCECNNDIVDLLLETLVKDENKIAFSNTINKNQTLTLHSSKGKEFEQVIIFADDFNDVETDEGTLNLLYVAITRAKHRLIIATSSYDVPLIGSFLKNRFELLHIKSVDIINIIK